MHACLTGRVVQELGLVAPLVGHVGDGNFHLLLLLDMSDGSELARAKQAIAELVRLALAMGGTCTGMCPSPLDFSSLVESMCDSCHPLWGPRH